LSEDGGNGRQVNAPARRGRHQPLRRSEPDRTIVGRLRLAERSHAAIRERRLRVRRHECGCRPPVELLRQLRQALDAQRVFELVPPQGGGRKPARRQSCEHLAPPRPDAPEERDKLVPPVLDESDFVATPGASCPGELVKRVPSESLRTPPLQRATNEQLQESEPSWLGSPVHASALVRRPLTSTSSCPSAVILRTRRYV